MLGNVFSFSGRRGRLSYFLTGLLLGVGAYVLIGSAYMITEASAPSESIHTPGTTMIFFISVILLLVGVVGSIWTGFAIAAQRFHDFGASGWWSLLSIVPLVGFVVGLVLLFARGNKLANQYGPVPMPGLQAPDLVTQ